MKDIMLRIVGNQFSDEGPEEEMEFFTEGKLYQRGENKYLIYDESEFSGFPGCKTSLKMAGQCVRMKRVGKEVGIGTELVFEKGKRFYGQYNTPYGNIDMEVLTNSVVNNLSEDGYGDVEIDYHVSFEGMVEGRNHLKISVSENNS